LFSLFSNEQHLIYFTIYLIESTESHLLNSFANRTENLRIIEGKLAITAIYEKYLNKDFTSARIAIKQEFTYGKFEIRAALPKGEMLRSAIELFSPINSEYAKNGCINVMDYFQIDEFKADIAYNFSPSYELSSYPLNSNLSHFHTYSMEWDNNEIKCFLMKPKF
jgi:beta-glucanase (GH16 family)